MSEEILKKIDFILKDPGQYAAEWTHETGRKAVGVFPNYFPVELLDAAGILPLGLWGAPVTVSQADTHFPAFVCSLIKSSFEMALKGDLHAVAGAVFPQICDSLQNSESVWRSLMPDSFTTRYRLSKNPDSKGARDFLIFEVKRIARELEQAFQVQFNELDLVEAILRRNLVRRKARELMERFYTGDIMLHPIDFYMILKASHVMDPEAWIEAANALTGGPRGLEFGGTRIFLSGMTCEPWWLLDELERVDATLVGDDLAFAHRAYQRDVSEQGDPFEALADHTLALAPCANLHQEVFARGEHLVERVKACRADGVVFTRLKFCDPEAFDHPHLKACLDQQGIPSLLLETDMGVQDTGAVATRVEAFMEQIESGGAQ